jgi:hypothetical protein
LPVIREPQAARIYLDNGKELIGDDLTVPPRPTQIAAVAAGFYGEVRSLDSQAARIDMRLEPVSLPSADEYERFVKLADSDITAHINDVDVSSIHERTLQLALRTRFLRETGNRAALDVLNRSIETLASYGDARAPVVRLLEQSIQAGKVERELISDQLLAAAERGDAMASFFAAQALREELGTANIPLTGSNPEFQAYCARLARASTQGWQAVADRYRSLDRCQRL